MTWIDSKTFDSGDKALWGYVLRRAVFDYALYKGSGKHRLRWQQANSFIFGKNTAEDGLTFDEVCALFGWDPDYIRRLTKKLDRTDIRRLESTFIREEFDADKVDSVVRPTWENSKARIPGVKPRAYSEEMSEALTPRRRTVENRSKVPRLNWSA